MNWWQHLREAWLDFLHPEQVTLRVQAQQDRERYDPYKLVPVSPPEDHRWVFRLDHAAYLNFERLGWLVLVPNQNRRNTIDELIAATGSEYWPYKVLIQDPYQVLEASKTIEQIWKRYKERETTVNVMEKDIQDNLTEVNLQAR